jgi:hypothetical protein
LPTIRNSEQSFNSAKSFWWESYTTLELAHSRVTMAGLLAIELKNEPPRETQQEECSSCGSP